MLAERVETSQVCSSQVIIAALNEEQGSGLTIKKLTENVPVRRILVVDGRSRDKTVEIAKDYGAKVFFKMLLVKAAQLRIHLIVLT